jgi:hypothetical protein
LPYRLAVVVLQVEEAAVAEEVVEEVVEVVEEVVEEEEAVEGVAGKEEGVVVVVAAVEALEVEGAVQVQDQVDRELEVLEMRIRMAMTKNHIQAKATNRSPMPDFFQRKSRHSRYSGAWKSVSTVPTARIRRSKSLRSLMPFFPRRHVHPQACKVSALCLALLRRALPNHNLVCAPCFTDVSIC